jgi:membrane-bound metal-dependent hydrolase YbcI (DUF457 family)
VYRKKAIPYFIALLSHSLIGDIYSNIDGIQLFWPFSSDWFYISRLSNRSVLSIGLELALFTVSTTIMVFNKDFQKSFIHKTSRIYWLVPAGIILGTLLIGRINSEYNLPYLLVFPSLFYLALFSLSIGLNYKKDVG